MVIFTGCLAIHFVNEFHKMRRKNINFDEEEYEITMNLDSQQGSLQSQAEPAPGWRRFIPGEPALKFLLPVLVFIWPAVYLFPYVFPIGGRYLAIGNDFTGLYGSYKFYLLDYLSHLTIPLWSPSEAAGFPFFSSPFTQTFYPLNLPLAAFYRFFGGYSMLEHQRFTILGLSIFGLGLYFWLRSLGLSRRPVLFGTFVMSVSLKITEIIRFPNAVHTAAWYPWVLFAITKIFRSTSTRQAVKYGVLLAFSLVCLLTGGYPYYVFYAVFLFGPTC